MARTPQINMILLLSAFVLPSFAQPVLESRVPAWSGSSSSLAAHYWPPNPKIEHLKMAHAVTASMAWVVFFPVGAIFMRVLKGPRTWLVHAFWQTLSMLVYIVATGTGIKLAKMIHWLDKYHAVIGLFIFAHAVVQCIAGLLHHFMFKKYAQRTVVSYVHLWLGRILITLGMINGGLALHESGQGTKAQHVAYGVVAGLIWMVWALVTIFTEDSKSRKAQAMREAAIIMQADKRMRTDSENNVEKRLPVRTIQMLWTEPRL